MEAAFQLGFQDSAEDGQAGGVHGCQGNERKYHDSVGCQTCPRSTVIRDHVPVTGDALLSGRPRPQGVHLFPGVIP